MRVLGIDPAIAALGHSLVYHDEQGAVLQEYDTLETPPKSPEGQRLKQIRAWLDSYLEVRQPHIVVMERPILRGAIVYNALTLGMACGIVLEACARHGVPTKEYFASDIKYTLTKNRSAKKPAIRAAVSAYLEVPLLKGKDDGIDAVAVALCHVIKQDAERMEVARVRA